MTEYEQQVITLLTEIRDLLEERPVSKGAVGGGRGRSSNLTQDQKDSIEEEIDLNWWFMNYGEEPLPAKYMSITMGIPAPGENHYSKDEGEYLYNRLQDYLLEPNEADTHIFQYLGKVWCPREKNARNCFGFVPKKSK